MKLSKEAQKDILLESFNILKSDYSNNYHEVNEIIGKIAAIDINASMDMWGFILNSNPEFVTDNAGFINDNRAYDITSLVLYYLSENISPLLVADAIASRPKIIEMVFGKSANIDSSQCEILAVYISRGDFDTANNIFRLVFSNIYNKGAGFSLTLGEIFQKIIDNMSSSANESSIEFLNEWIQQIRDPQEKAKAYVRFLDLMK